jgi:NAD(P)-dependent dehydrogenase (short-subunit alcohol dehydrogenase family)
MIILTGISGGIGNLLLRRLLEIDNVIGIYNKNIPEKIESERLTYESVDLKDKDKIISFISKYEKELSRITLIHCAAVKKDNLAVNYDLDDWDDVFDVNLKGNFILTKYLLNEMISEGWGRIIHLSSKGAENGDPGTIAYSASKTALFGMSKVLSKEYARFNITSNLISLGAFNTGLYSSLDQKVKDEIISKVPSKKLGGAYNITNAIKFLIESDYVNGSVITIDGGV